MNPNSGHGYLEKGTVLFYRKESRELQCYSSRCDNELTMPRPAGSIRQPLGGQTSQTCSVFPWFDGAPVSECSAWFNRTPLCHRGLLVPRGPEGSQWSPLLLGATQCHNGPLVPGGCEVSEWSLHGSMRPCSVTRNLWLHGVLKCHSGPLVP